MVTADLGVVGVNSVNGSIISLNQVAVSNVTLIHVHSIVKIYQYITSSRTRLPTTSLYA